MKHPNSEAARSSRSTRFAYLAAIFAAACMGFHHAGVAQSLDDWKAALSAAKSGQGAESIPYSSLRSDVDGKKSSIENYCKKEEWSCDGAGTKSVREIISGIKSRLEASEVEKRNLEAKLDELKKEMERMAKVREEKERNLVSDLERIDKRIATGTKCIEARTVVFNAFKSAIDKAKSESDPEIKKIADDLITYWEKGQETHKDQIETTKAGLERCQKCKTGEE